MVGLMVHHYTKSISAASVSKEWFLILLRKDKKKLSIQNLTATLLG
jgi:hypothetical protein